MTINQLINWRNKLGMSQVAFAEYTGYKRRQIQRFESGEYEISPKLIAMYNQWRKK